MKKLADGTHVADWTYYYLLHWNTNDNYVTMKGLSGKNNLNDLSIKQYYDLFDIATTIDKTNIDFEMKGRLSYF